MFNCRQVSRLISLSMDAPLPWHRSLGMKVHLLYCAWCRRYSAQLQFLRRAIKELPPEALEPATAKLSIEEKHAMRSRLLESFPNLPPSPD
jgi:hypothetical protein